MKIICTLREKLQLLETFEQASTCLFGEEYVSCLDDCDDCFQNKIKWEIKDGEQECTH